LAIAVDKQYELVLMLDPDVPDERRDEIAAQTRQRIEAGGTLKHDASWGMRGLAYEIRQRTEADYRLFRFEGESGVLDELNHNLRIADGVLRFRIFKVDPDSPTIVPPPAMGTSGAPTRAPRRDEAPAEAAAEAPSEPAAPAEAAAEAPSEPEAPAEAAAEAPSEAATEEPATEEPAQAEPAPEEAAPAPAADAPDAAEPAPEAAAEEPEAPPAPESGEEPTS
jgi:small subunit ribosomal protein S6